MGKSTTARRLRRNTARERRLAERGLRPPIPPMPIQRKHTQPKEKLVNVESV